MSYISLAKYFCGPSKAMLKLWNTPGARYGIVGGLFPLAAFFGLWKKRAVVREYVRNVKPINKAMIRTRRNMASVAECSSEM